MNILLETGGLLPIEYVPGEDSEDYKAWLERNDKV